MSDKILKLSQAQTLYQDLRGRIDALPTDSDIPEVPVQDVQVNSTSILSNGVANVPIATMTSPGVIQPSEAFGLQMNTGNYAKYIMTYPANSTNIKTADTSNSCTYRPITPVRQHAAAFYGLAKAAGDSTQSASDNAVGVYTDNAKQKIQNMLGITDLLSTEESSTATDDHAINSTFMMNGKLHRATVAIAIGDAVVVGTNCEVVKADEIFVKTTDYGDDSHYGLVRSNASLGFSISGGVGRVAKASDVQIKEGTNEYRPIVPKTQHQSIYYGLSKLAGVDLANETVTVGTYPETSKAGINAMIGSVSKKSVEDAGITGYTYTTLYGGEFTVTTTVDSDWLSPHAHGDTYSDLYKHYMHQVIFDGTEYVLPSRQWFVVNENGIPSGKTFEYVGNLNLYISDISGVPGGTDNVPFFITTVNNQSENSCEILTSVAGEHTFLVKRIANTQTELPIALIYGKNFVPLKTNDLESSSYNGFSIGVNELRTKRGTFAFGYQNIMTNDFSFAIGTANRNSQTSTYAIGSGNDLSGVGGIAIGDDNQVEGANAFAIGSNIVANGSNMVAVGRYNVAANKTTTNWTNSTAYTVGQLVQCIFNPSPSGTSPVFTMVCTKNHTSASSGTFYQDYQSDNTRWAFAVSDGDTLFAIGNGTGKNSRSNALKVDNAGNMQIRGNVYVNCNADSSGGTMLPQDVQVNGTSIVTNGVANIPCANSETFGVVKTNANYGTYINTYNEIGISRANISKIKAGADQYRPITPYGQHESVFYGLTKAAGVDMASSSNSIGSYTDEAKTAIQTMLGIEKSVELIEIVSSTTPTIIGQPNVIYKCSEVLTLSITPPANGTIDVYFTSGSTATTLTVPNTVKFPGWFNPSALDTSTIYEIMITDGVYGSVMAWQS